MSVSLSRGPSKDVAVNFTPTQSSVSSAFFAMTLIRKYFPGSECDVSNSIPSILISDMYVFPELSTPKFSPATILQSFFLLDFAIATGSMLSSDISATDLSVPIVPMLSLL